MEDHFSKILNTFTGGAVAFIESSKFTGAKKGYVFHLADRGLGYYLDPSSNKNAIQMEGNYVSTVYGATA